MAEVAVGFGVLEHGATHPLMTMLMALSLGACAPHAEPAQPARPIEQVRGPFRVLSPREQVPPFRLIAIDGSELDSDALVGKRAFVIVFFTSWCRVCELELPIVSEAAARNGREVAFVGVSIDDSETWPEVAETVRRHELDFPIVRGQWFPRFALAYDPMLTVPVVAVVGRNGYLVDYETGWAPDHRERLNAAVAVARGDLP